MTEAELDDFLTGQRTCRVATVGSRGPHLTALWYVWHGTAGTRGFAWSRRDHQLGFPENQSTALIH